MAAIYPYRDYMKVGGVRAYAVDLVDLYRHAAGESTQLPKGVRVGDDPLYQAMTFGLMINLNTVKAGPNRAADAACASW